MEGHKAKAVWTEQIGFGVLKRKKKKKQSWVYREGTVTQEGRRKDGYDQNTLWDFQRNIKMEKIHRSSEIWWSQLRNYP